VPAPPGTTPAAPTGPGAGDETFARAVAHGDEHAIKFADTAVDVHARTGDETLPDDRYKRTLDPWVCLAAAAAVTSRIRLGTAVALPAESDPITLAKTIATLDHLSGGRVTLGAGFGWNTDELTDHGVPHPSTLLRC
jgi:alkanesulfonate monooxygenase SsuD/methylene tetrahydromethanopterin reductase-like flavin-dependent oxidoreductase (luciferase family)